MTADDTDRPTVDPVDGDPLSTTDPTWRDDGADEEDTERTIDADPAWLAELRAERSAGTAGHDDAERTIDADADLIEHVRATTRAARSALAEPPDAPADAAPADAAPAGAPATTAVDPRPTPPPAVVDPSPARPPVGIDPSLPVPPAGVRATPPGEARAGLPPPTPGGPRFATAPALAPDTPATAAPAPSTAATPAAAPSSPATPLAAPSPATPPAVAPSTAATPDANGRWQPPARLRPTEVRATAPLITDRTPTRGHLDRRWALAGVVVAAIVGFLIALAVTSGDDAPDPPPGPTTVPGASTTVSTP
jgi:hypothetical protein